ILGLILISSTAGYAFARMEFKFKNILFMLFLSTLMVPVQVTLVPRFVLFKWIGIYDTHFSLILPSMFNVIGIFLYRQFLISIPMELSESAKIDGASHFRIWSQIMMPLSKSAMISLVILGFTWTWNDYMNPLIFLTSKNLYTIPVGLQALIDEEGINFNLFMAGATCAIVPVMIVFFLCQKYFIEGVASSAIKG
ncbi:MAG: carbohydrate ABC transporter permease, partial [Proteobacteria bacterium]|nr:carbohydrate ABC transporter permease [Pseudomonadota bacterium]